MDSADLGQVSHSAADIYETFFVPALFAEWAPVVADAARISAGDRVLDVACGTGALAREALAHVGPEGMVAGLDRNAGMLATAARYAEAVDWREGLAEDIPWPDASFDGVVSQFGLMFFEDRPKALAEMFRVLRPGGRMAVAVWGDIGDAPGYVAMTALLESMFGEKVASALRAPYCLGDREALLGLFEAAGIADASVETRTGRARFPSVEAWVHTDIKGWTLADMIDDAQYALLQRAAPAALSGFVEADGSVDFDHPAHIAVAVKA